MMYKKYIDFRLGIIEDPIYQMCKNIAFTNGHFDLLHPGHIRTFKYMQETYGYTVVGINCDKETLRQKSRVIIPAKDRKFMVESCKYVNKAIIFYETTPAKLISFLMPNVIVKGDDYTNKKVAGYIPEHNKLELLPRDSYSTSMLISKIKEL